LECPEELEWWIKNEFWSRGARDLSDMAREASLSLAMAIAEGKMDARETTSLVEETWFLAAYLYKAGPDGKALLTPWLTGVEEVTL